MSLSSTTLELVGWTSEPNGRGTLGLLTTCLTTIFLYTWVVIHPRVYESETYATCHKLALLANTLLDPEFIAVEGLQEWAQCRRMVEICSGYTGGEFKLSHAYYIRTSCNRIIWPNQFTWLLEQGLFNWNADHASWGLTESQIHVFAPTVSYWNIWDLTPRVFEKGRGGKGDGKEDARSHHESQRMGHSKSEIRARKDIVVAHWDPYLYRSKIIRALCSLFRASFGALHLACWNTAFPTLAEKSPALYFASRVLMMGEVFAALRAVDKGVYETYEVANYGIQL
ncbi:uncharacterized protein BDW70DRAFT_166974 [Aspergillus foveolatus]|uniref:uncharacterized protein n=1 Tax=Aspergillus foveolatus TaxID=210207 RepID=UPI003CCD7E4E